MGTKTKPTFGERLASIEAKVEALPRIEAKLDDLCMVCPKYRERVDVNRRLLVVTWMAIVSKWIYQLSEQGFFHH